MLSKEWQPPTCAFIPEFRCATGYTRESRADAIAMSLWPSSKNGMELVGFELKISRSDWLHELKNPYKADPIKQFCDRWYVVTANSGIVKYPDELPEGWGLIFAEENKLVTFIEAKKLTPKEIDRPFLGALMRRATRVDGLAHLVPTNTDYKPKK